MEYAEVAAYGGLFVLWFVTIVGGMALAESVAANDLVMFQDPGDVGNVGVFAVILLVSTGIMLLAFRYANMFHLRLGMALFFGLYLGIPFVLVTDIGTLVSGGPFTGLPSSPIPIAIGLLAGILIFVYPEWYVIDVFAVVLGALVIPMFGLGFGPLPIVVLLVVWAIYDAYAVYGSGHMGELAEGITEVKMPFVYVMPQSRSFSMVGDDVGLGLGDGDESEDSAETADADSAKEAQKDDAGTDETQQDDNETEETDAETGGQPMALLGLGDAIIPGMLAVSAAEFLDAPTVVPALNANLPAIGAIAGGFVGMIALLVIVHRYEGAHAGLPPLNAGVLLGYFLGAVAAGIPLTAALGL
jgi:presenilin-like A22 family membrane protease